MDIIIICSIALLVGFHLGESVAIWRVRKNIRQIAKSLGMDLDKDLAELQEQRETKILKVRRLEIEKVNDMLYLYDKETRDFICQGSSMQELAKLAKEYKNIIGAVVIDGDRVFTFTDGQSEEYKVQ
jgi:uncharacterized membrane-anchored protein YhcB (DUF1043 family)